MQSSQLPAEPGCAEEQGTSLVSGFTVRSDITSVRPSATRLTITFITQPGPARLVTWVSALVTLHRITVPLGSAADVCAQAWKIGALSAALSPPHRLAIPFWIVSCAGAISGRRGPAAGRYLQHQTLLSLLHFLPSPAAASSCTTFEYWPTGAHTELQITVLAVP